MKIISKVARGAMQPAAKGALTQIRASVDANVKGGDYFGPDGIGEMFGYPVLVKSNAASHNVEDAKRLWDISEKLTGISFS